MNLSTFDDAQRVRTQLRAEGKPTYRVRMDGATAVIECCCCCRVSAHPQDIAALYCGYCHVFHADPILLQGGHG